MKRSIAGDDAPLAKKSRMTRAAAPAGAAPEIDEDLHSRQLAVYGRESMRRMAASNILIVGVAGLGVEIGAPAAAATSWFYGACCSLCKRGARVPAAKNVILAGVKSVTLLDDGTVEMRDLSAQFYLAEADVGKKRAAACRGRLQELNTAVAVSVVAGWPSDRELLKYQARSPIHVCQSLSWHGSDSSDSGLLWFSGIACSSSLARVLLLCTVRHKAGSQPWCLWVNDCKWALRWLSSQTCRWPMRCE